MGLYHPSEIDLPEAETVSTDFTLEEFLAWVRTKPADETYPFVDCGGCALAQFIKETRRASEPNVGPCVWFDDERSPHGLLDGLNDILNPYEFSRDIFTFGALAARLEAELAR